MEARRKLGPCKTKSLPVPSKQLVLINTTELLLSQVLKRLLGWDTCELRSFSPGMKREHCSGLLQ